MKYTDERLNLAIYTFLSIRAMFVIPRLPLSLLLLLDIALCHPFDVQPQQTPLDTVHHISLHEIISPRPLHGRFLHITDLHPDPYYKFNTTVASGCHHFPKERNGLKDKNKEERRAGYWGTPQSACDNSFAFVNFTLDWIEKEWADDIDFVIWTGDNARHDEDPSQPRTLEEIFDTNRYVAERMHSIFAIRGIPVVPSLGEKCSINLVLKFWSLELVFQRGGYYSSELIDNQLAALSLNTLYFYEKNKATGGCSYRDEADPGNLQLDWMDVQLEQFRSRGMKVWLTGHVPPTPDNYYNECFFFLDAEHLKEEPEEEELFSKKDQIHKSLKKHLKKISKKKEKKDEIVVVNVAPAGVGNPYQPGLRVFAYNHTGETGIGSGVGRSDTNGSEEDIKGDENPWEKPKKCKKRKNLDKWECRGPEKEWYSGKQGPARKNTLWTPLGYSQFWVPDLGSRNEREPPTWELEYVTYGREGFEERLPAKLAEKILANLTDEHIPYEMVDLTLDSWLDLVEKIRNKKKQWKKFKERMYLSRGQ
ncbi:hypothetical protein Clacol_001661 [Clathrus columnatus]|uniref:Calcineurin-like phosphoesterase domain-containing protein n=1 Tax=Clathrus columnatus TaxID=1419009 RepID=A0AAV5A2F8_9AGAM|nr:hypothetical protein Clacol_001661 [Clathrus columnatus]